MCLHPEGLGPGEEGEGRSQEEQGKGLGMWQGTCPVGDREPCLGRGLLGDGKHLLPPSRASHPWPWACPPGRPSAS